MMRFQAKLRMVNRIAFPLFLLALLIVFTTLWLNPSSPILNWLLGTAFLLSLPTLVEALVAPIWLWQESRGRAKKIPDDLR